MEKGFAVVKRPMHEEDSAFLSVDTGFVNRLRSVLEGDEYLKLKQEKFLNKDVSSDGFYKFSYRPSLKNIPSFLEGTIYTFSCEKKNGMSYKNIIDTVKSMLDSGSRRAFVTMSDRLLDYRGSINNDIDVSCLSSVHYKRHGVTLMFRASDIENELMVDILTIYDHFIRPVYVDKNIKIDLMISSCQNVDFLCKFETI